LSIPLKKKRKNNPSLFGCFSYNQKFIASRCDKQLGGLSTLFVYYSIVKKNTVNGNDIGTVCLFDPWLVYPPPRRVDMDMLKTSDKMTTPELLFGN
jgi:hypothetical protein